MDDGSDLELDITDDNSKRSVISGSGAPSPNSKRSRRSVQKRVVSIPMSELEASRAKSGGGGEGAPPSDSWAWRKYGQKPIKGSPYPRGYYRCSSSKGCPARKQVERSRLDPSMIVVTYSFDHNHTWPLPKTKNHAAPPPVTTIPAPPTPPTPPAEETTAPTATEEVTMGISSSPNSEERDDRFLDLIGGDGGDFQWLEGCSPSSASPPACEEMLYGSVFFGGGAAAAVEGLPEIGEDDDALFAGLGELPECSVVFRRGLTSAPWVGTT